MKTCEACFASMPDHESSCPSCGLPARDAPARAEAPQVAPPPEVPAIAEPPPPPPAPAVVQTPCPKHPASESLGACVRCGTFYCQTCEPDARRGEKVTCLSCRRALAPEQRKKVLNEFLVSSLLLAALLVGGPGILLATLGATDRGLAILASGGCGAFFLVLLAVLLRATGKAAFAWVLFAIEVLMFGGMAIASPSLITIVLLVAIVGFTFRSANRLGDLDALIRGQSASSAGASM